MCSLKLTQKTQMFLQKTNLNTFLLKRQQNKIPIERNAKHLLRDELTKKLTGTKQNKQIGK